MAELIFQVVGYCCCPDRSDGHEPCEISVLLEAHYALPALMPAGVYWCITRNCHPC